jgi:hypothetical protein
MSDVDAPAVPIATGPGVGEGGDGLDATGPEQREHTRQEPGLAQRLDIVKQGKPVENYRLGRLEVGEEGAEGVRHAGPEHCNTNQVGAVVQAKSKAVRRQLVEVVVVAEEVGGFGSVDRSDLITVGYKRLACSVTMPPHDALLAPALTEVGSG